MQKKSAAQRGVPLFVFFIFLLVGSAAAYFIFLKPLTQSISARQWLTVPCRVLSSEVKSHSGSDNETTYSVEISYVYQVNGREYRSDRYQFLRMSSSGREGKAKAVARYPRGTNTVCYINPKNPAEAVLNRELGGAFWFGLIPLAFIAVGLSGVIFTLRSRRYSAANAFFSAGDANAANQPWLQRADWATGRITSSTKTAMLGVWFFAGIWNLISTPIAGVILSEHAIRKGDHRAAVVLIFPLVGIGLLYLAVKITLRWLKFGESVFEMACVPGIIGGALEGSIRPSRPIRPEGPVQLRLNCLARTTSSNGSDGSSTRESILWQHEEAVEMDNSGAIPVAFYIPADCSETNTFGSGDGILWRLEAHARVEGLDYATQFEVPVFQVEQTPEQRAEAEKLLVREQAALAAYVQPPSSRIRVQMALRGGTEFYFPAFRNPGPALFLLIFSTIWIGVICFMITQHAPIFFPVVFSAFGLLLLFALGTMLFGTTRVEVALEGITVTRSLLGISRTKTLAASDIFEIKTKTGMTSGTTAYRDLKIVLSNGKEINAGSTIRDGREAEWLAAEMTKALLGKSSAVR